MARGKRDVRHFSDIWRFCTQTPPDLVFIAKVLQDQFDIYSTQMYVPILRMESKWQHTRAYCFHSVINYDQLLKALSACSNF